MNNFKYLFFSALVGLVACNDNNDAPTKTFEKPINTMAIDNTNTLWIGSDDGLYKKVGDDFEKVNISINGKIQSLSYNKLQQVIWVGTEQGLLSIGADGNVLNEVVVANDLLSNTSVFCYQTDDYSKNWFGTKTGITLNYGNTWKNDSFRINTLNNVFPAKIESYTINSIAFWEDDYYVATSGAALYKLSGYNNDVDAFSSATQWASPYNGTSITDSMFVVFIDSKGDQWMGGKNGIQVHTGHYSRAVDNMVYHVNELPGSYVYAVNEAPNGDIWVGTENGLAIYNGTSWRTIKEGLPDLKVSAIVFDKDGVAWVGTARGLANIN